MSSTIININLINLSTDVLTDTPDLLFVVKQPTVNPNPLILISQELTIRHYFSKDTMQKIYYFQLNYTQPNNLNTENFVLRLPSNLYHVYDYYNSQPNKSLQIYPLYTWVPFVFVGQMYNTQIIINYLYQTVKPPVNQVYNKTQTLCLTTNPYGKSNISNNKLQLDGSVWKINDITIESNDLTTTYVLYNISVPIYLNVETVIYFIDNTQLSPLMTSIEYMNIYSQKKLCTCTCICTGTSISTCTSTGTGTCTLPIAFNITDGLSNNKTFIQTLRLTAFDYLKPLSVVNPTNYYNMIFYYTQYSPNSSIQSINSIDLFVDNYTKYFNLDTTCTVSVGTDLYQIVCVNNPYIQDPQILIFDPAQYAFIERTINLNKIFLCNLIEFLTMCDRFYKITSFFTTVPVPNAWNFSNCVEYLNTWTIVPYNVYRIVNPLRSCVRFEEMDNMVNCVVCKIIFWIGTGTGTLLSSGSGGETGYYMLDGVMILDNYSINIYHKNYDLESESNGTKKDLVKLLLVLNAMCWGIDIVVGNVNFSNPYVFSSYSSSSVLFNVIRLRKINKMFDLSIGAEYTDIERQTRSLRLDIKINVPYYLMMFNAPLELNYEKMRFESGTYSFYLYQVSKPNYLTERNIYVIGFQDLYSLNVFVNFLTKGVIVQDLNNYKSSNWTNIIKSVCFTNYYMLNENWIFDPDAGLNPEPKTQIEFSIINLYVNRIFLHKGCMMEFCV